MESTLWAALAGASAAGAFTLLGVWLSNLHAAKERAADRQHELNLERARQSYSEAAIRREFSLAALQQFSAQAETLVRSLEMTCLTDGRIDPPDGVNLDDLKAELEHSMLALELLASDGALRAAQSLVRLIRLWDVAYWETNRIYGPWKPGP